MEKASLALMAVAVAAFFLLSTRFDVGYINPDVHQQIGSAREIARGSAYGASTLYYDVQVQQGFGARQTIWPIGYPLLLAVLSKALSVDPLLLAQPLSVLGHLLAAILLWLWIRRVGYSATFALWPCVGYLALPVVSQNAASGWNEGWVIAAWIGSVLAAGTYFSDRSRSWWLLLASGLASVAFLLRYSGIAVVGAFIATICWDRWIRKGSAAGWGASEWTSLLMPPVVVAATLGRNYIVVDSLTGATHPYREASGDTVVQQVMWTSERLLGASSAAHLALILATSAVASWVSRPQWMPSTVPAVRAGWQVPKPDVLYLVLGWMMYSTLAVTFASLHEAYKLDTRYMLPMAFQAFALLALGAARPGPSTRAPTSIRYGVGTLAVAILGASLYVGHLASERWWTNPARGTRIPAALRSPMGDGTVSDAIRTLAEQYPGLIVGNSQSLGAYLDVPTVALADPTYTDNVWDLSTVCGLARRLGTPILVVLDESLVGPTSPSASPLVSAVIRGETLPAVVTKLWSTNGVHVLKLGCDQQ